MQEQNAIQTRQAEVEDLLRKKKNAIIKACSRAGRDEWKKWAAGFDRERLSKGGGLIEFFEVAPFVECNTLQEYLHNARLFAGAFRSQGEDVADIQPGEVIDHFIRRVHEKWYSSAPLGQIFYFAQLATGEFDDDCGYSRERPWDYSTWVPILGTEISLTAEEIAALPRMKELPQWKKEGFSNYVDWKEHFDQEERKRKNHEILESHLRSKEEIDRDLNKTPSDEAPQLHYQAVITEH